jgi:hypothetical protein
VHCGKKSFQLLSFEFYTVLSDGGRGGGKRKGSDRIKFLLTQILLLAPQL